jgi:hypothetical protein
MLLNLCKFGRNRKVTKGTLLFVLKQVFHPHFACHSSGVTQTSHVALPANGPHPLQVWSESGVKKGTLLLRTKHFFAPVAPHVAVWWFKYHMWHFQHMHYKVYRFGRNRSVTKGTYSRGRYSFWSPSCLAFHRCDSNITSGTPSKPAQPVYVWSKSGSNEGHFTLDAEKVFDSCLALYFLPMTHTLCKCGQNWAVTKGTLFLMPRQLFVPQCSGVNQI